MVAFVDGHQEQRVGLVDALVGEALEECGEGGVVLLELLDVSRLPRPERVAPVLVVMVVVDVREIGVSDRDPGLLGCRRLAERVVGLLAVKQ
ncbi:MAG: hypothetical protein ACXVUL_09575 [Solirubrobacteraceae bacterium]